MKRYLPNIILISALLIGICLLLYPSVSDYVNSVHQTKAIYSYEQVTQNLTQDQNMEVFEAAHTYNELIAETEHVFFQPDLVPGYEDVLDTTGTGIMAYITIDKIKVELPVYHNCSEGVLQIAVGHLPGTSLPVGGEGTHAVLTGHRGLPSSKLFTDLDKLDVGDTFTITVLNQVLAYQVDQIRVVLPEETDELRLIPGEDHVTLLTCTPYGINSHRLLVRGKRVEYEGKKGPVYVANEAYQIDPMIVMPAVAVPILVLLAIWWSIRTRRRAKQKKIYRKGMERDETK